MQLPSASQAVVLENIIRFRIQINFLDAKLTQEGNNYLLPPLRQRDLCRIRLHPKLTGTTTDCVKSAAEIGNIALQRESWWTVRRS
jgi:hypothetical protein